MFEVSKEVGKKIKYYRKKRNLSAEALASRIFKGKSTYYKYENGTIAMDVETLDQVAKVLEVPMARLLDSAPQEEATAPGLHPFGSATSLYVYCYLNKRILYSRLALSYDKAQEKYRVTLHYDMEGGKAQATYTGDMASFDFVTYFMMTSDLQRSERLHICAFNPWSLKAKTWGLMFGLLDGALAPGACKVLISMEQIPDCDLNLMELVITKEELKKLKSYNMFYLSQNGGNLVDWG